MTRKRRATVQRVQVGTISGAAKGAGAAGGVRARGNCAAAGTRRNARALRADGALLVTQLPCPSGISHPISSAKRGALWGVGQCSPTHPTFPLSPDTAAAPCCCSH